MAVTVLKCKASTQQIRLLLVPAIKGAVYINTHSNYSQPALTKLDNENIGGHRYTFTAPITRISCYDHNLASVCLHCIRPKYLVL